MATVIASMSMSLDGFIADPSDGTEQVFGWYFNGDTTVPTAAAWLTFQTSEASAEVMRDALANVGALISGRRLFDVASGWGGTHPMGVPVFVVTRKAPDDWPHEGFTFVTDGVQSAVAQAKVVAGAKRVAVASPKIAQQCLDAGLLDEVHVDLVPVLLGAGIPFFENLTHSPVDLDDPRVTEGTGVTHLAYKVRK